MKLISKDFQDQEIMDSFFTCDGDDSRPHLIWSEIRPEAKSLALSMFDPDAPGDGWLHYLAVNLPAQDTELNRSDQLPTPGKELNNDFGKTEYGGPCPPSGKHRYVFTLYALDIEEINPADYHDFLQIVNDHAIDQASITGLYQRQ